MSLHLPKLSQQVLCFQIASGHVDPLWVFFVFGVRLVGLHRCNSRVSWLDPIFGVESYSTWFFTKNLIFFPVPRHLTCMFVFFFRPGYQSIFLAKEGIGWTGLYGFRRSTQCLIWSALSCLVARQLCGESFIWPRFLASTFYGIISRQLKPVNINMISILVKYG